MDYYPVEVLNTKNTDQAGQTSCKQVSISLLPVHHRGVTDSDYVVMGTVLAKH